jgi:quercetin dioxygenase-like cupin family protein
MRLRSESQCCDNEIPLERKEEVEGHQLRLSQQYPASSMLFIELPEGFAVKPHHAPAQQLVVILSGILEVTTSDNKTRQWCAGDVVFADDLTGKGHKTRTVGGAARLLYLRSSEGICL